MEIDTNKNPNSRRKGVALIFTVVVLVLLTALVYQLSSAVSQWKHRMQYMIDYQTARYGCESGLQYALAAMQEIDANYISRPNEPDFSDLFTMSDEEYKLMMLQYAQQLQMQIDINNINKGDMFTKFMDLSRSDSNDGNSVATDSNSNNQFPQSAFRNHSKDFNDINDVNNTMLREPNDPNELYVRGPYGPPWPYVTKPVEIEFGDARITIEIIDENAKLPLVWGICADPNSKNESKAAIETFCEWMQMKPNDIESLTKEFDEVKLIKPFSIDLKPVVIASTADNNTAQSSGSRARRISRLRQRSRVRDKVILQERAASGHTLDYAKILHSPMIDIEMLAKPVNQDETRSESALKYLSLWGTQKVNVNTAPRQVLESAFTFGGDAPEIAQKIIDERKVKPFISFDDFKKRLISYNSSIIKVEPYITTVSDCFSIRVRATSGTAKVCATAAVKKEKDKVQRIGIIIE